MYAMERLATRWQGFNSETLWRGREKKNRCGLGLDKENKDLHLSRRRLYEETHRFSCSCDRIVSGAVFFLSHLICAELICP